MPDFVTLIDRLTHPLLKYLHDELGNRVTNLDEWYTERAPADRDWAVRAVNARKALLHKQSLVRRRIATVEDFSLAQLVVANGDMVGFRGDCRVQVKFLLNLIDRSVDPEQFGSNELVALAMVRDSVVAPLVLPSPERAEV